MSYEKQTWQTGDVVTSAKLNYMEDGIADGGALVVNVTVGEGASTCDKTAGEIVAAFPLVVFTEADDVGAGADWVSQYGYDPDYGYYIKTLSDTEYTAATENDYPTSAGPK